jgi:hypothetical protein
MKSAAAVNWTFDAAACLAGMVRFLAEILKPACQIQRPKATRFPTTLDRAVPVR